MYRVQTSRHFRRDVKRCQKQGKNMQLFKDVDALLIAGQPLPQLNRDHALSGNW